MVKTKNIKNNKKVKKAKSVNARRKLRSNQRETTRNITKYYTELSKVENDEYDKKVKETNEQFKQVAFVREAQLDAENRRILNAAFANQADSLAESVRTFHYKEFIKHLRRHFINQNENDFQWSHLGIDSAICINSIPKINFLHGIIDTDIQPKVKTQRQKRDRYKTDESKTELKKPEVVKKSKKDDGKIHEEPTALRLSILSKTLEKNLNNEKKNGNYNKKDTPEIDAMNFLINPDSFTQTIENFFDFSFLIKQGTVGVKLNNDNTPNIFPRVHNPDEIHKTQSVLSMNLKEFNKLKNLYHIKESTIPDRGY